MNFMKDIRTTITTTEQINRIIDKYEAEQEEADDTEDLYGDAQMSSMIVTRSCS